MRFVPILLAVTLSILLGSAHAAPLRDRAAPAFAVSQWFGTAPDKPPAPADYRGKVLVITVVGSEAQAPEVLRQTAHAARPYIKDNEVEFLAIHTGPTEAAMRKTFDDTGLACPVGLDAGFAKAYGIETTPWSVIVGGRGVVRFSGPFPGVKPLGRRIEAWRPSTQRGGRIVGQRFGTPTGLRWLTRDGEPVDFSAHPFTLVRWWTDDCPHCAASVPALNTLWERYRERGLHLLAVYHPKRRVPTSEPGVRAYAKRLGYTGDIAYDRRWTKLKDLMRRGALDTATSVSFLVDRTGTIVWAHAGPRLYWNRTPRWRSADRDIRDLDSRLALWLPPR